MKNIGLVTNTDYPLLFPDDQLLMLHLKSKGFVVEPVIWSEKKVEWKKFDLLIIRSVWDYHKRQEEFKKWLLFIKNEGIIILNEPETILKNIHKSYLLDFVTDELPVIPTILIQQKDKSKIKELLSDINSETLVIKPAVSLSAYNTFLAQKNESHLLNKKINDLLEEGDVLVQPFIPEVQTLGELSLIFFNGKFSHAIKKIPTQNDFRVQADYGGSQTAVNVSGSLISQAAKFINNLNKKILYARVDGIVIKEKFHLMELEMIDPVLFFSIYTPALENFSEALNELITLK